MNEWKCTVKTPSNWLQTVKVEAYTHSDAVAFAESMTGGKCIMAVVDNSTSSSNNGGSFSSGGSQISGGAVLGLLLVLFLISAWKYILIFGCIAFVIWALMKWCQSMDDLS